MLSNLNFGSEAQIAVIGNLLASMAETLPIRT